MENIIVSKERRMKMFDLLSFALSSSADTKSNEICDVIEEILKKLKELEKRIIELENKN